MRIDTDAGAAYLQMTQNHVARTVQFTETVYVDLDEFGMVVGVEVLDLGLPVPLDLLAEQYHIGTETLDLLINTIKWGAPKTAMVSSSNTVQATSFGTVLATSPAN